MLTGYPIYIELMNNHPFLYKMFNMNKKSSIESIRGNNTLKEICRRNKIIISGANDVEKENMDSINWLTSNNLWNEDVTKNAAKYGDLHVILWALHMDYPINLQDVFDIASQHGNIKIIQMFYDIICDEDTDATDNLQLLNKIREIFILKNERDM